jgi:hypothetical protein
MVRKLSDGGGHWQAMITAQRLSSLVSLATIAKIAKRVKQTA